MRGSAIILFVAVSAFGQSNPACQFKATIKNQTGKTLVGTQMLPTGTWTKQPASSIASGSEDTFSSSGRAWDTHGTQGQMKYKLDGGSDTVTTIFWNIPWATPETIMFTGSNAVSIQKNDRGCTLDSVSLGPTWACKQCWLMITVSSTAH